MAHAVGLRATSFAVSAALLGCAVLGALSVSVTLNTFAPPDAPAIPFIEIRPPEPPRPPHAPLAPPRQPVVDTAPIEMPFSPPVGPETPYAGPISLPLPPPKLLIRAGCSDRATWRGTIRRERSAAPSQEK
jgi:hypothetical protein